MGEPLTCGHVCTLIAGKETPPPLPRTSVAAPESRPAAGPSAPLLDAESSLRLDLLRFPLIVGVVFIHAYESTVGLAGGPIGTSQTSFVAEFVRNFVSQGLARVAVPVFFLLSGYLFFLGFQWSREKYFAKLRKRIRTLLLPFLFWNLATLALVALAQAMPGTQVFFSGKHPPVAGYGLYDYLDATIGIDRMPIAYQFWFLRDLMILVLLAPLVSWMNRASAAFSAILFICWFTDCWPLYTPSAEAALFFSLGGLVAGRGDGLFALDRYGLPITVVYLLVLSLDAASHGTAPLNPYLHRFGMVLGVVVALYITKLVARRDHIRSLILGLGGASFFVYAAHEPLLTIARKVAYRLLIPQSSWLVLILYFAIPTGVVVLLVWVDRVLRRIAPRALGIVTGGR